MSEQQAQGADAAIDLNNELKARREKLAALREPSRSNKSLMEMASPAREVVRGVSAAAQRALSKKVWLKTLAHKGLRAAAMLICMRFVALWRPSRISRAT